MQCWSQAAVLRTRHLTPRSSGHPTAYRGLPLNATLGASRAECKCLGTTAASSSNRLWFSARFASEAGAASSRWPRASSRSFLVWHRPHVSRSAVRAQSSSGRDRRGLPVLRRSAHRGAGWRQSKPKSAASGQWRGASVASLNASPSLRACARLVHTRKHEEQVTPAAVSRTAAPRCVAR